MRIIKLNKKFYTKEAIDTSKKEFSSFCDVSIEESDEYYHITIIANEQNNTKIDLEFCNFCLGLSK